MSARKQLAFDGSCGRCRNMAHIVQHTGRTVNAFWLCREFRDGRFSSEVEKALTSSFREAAASR